MANARDVRDIDRGMDVLRESSLKGMANANRAMLQPLLDVIRETPEGSDERATMRVMRDRLPELFDMMDETAIAEAVEQLMMQTYGIGHTGAVPDGMDDPELGIEVETLEHSTGVVDA